MLQPWMTVEVTKRTVEAEDVVVLELADSSGADLLPFSAGSHIDVEVKTGLVRQYSLCNNPTECNRYVIGVLKDPATRGGSAALHEIVAGQQLRISEPRNHFELDGSAARSLLFAGGIGVTPILCMAERLAALGADFEMHYGARAQARAAFYDRIRTSSFASKVHFHFDDGDEAQKLDIDQALGQTTQGIHIYVCGPAAFIELVVNAAQAKGFTDAQLHREYFNVDAAETPIEGKPFQIKLASTGQVLTVPANRSVIDVLRDVGIELPVSCEEGVCGTCLTRVLEGIPEHRDCFLTSGERAKNDRFTPCCSRSETPMLVIDV